MKTISKKQIKQLDKGETTVRELFPEVFETSKYFIKKAKELGFKEGVFIIPVNSFVKMKLETNNFVYDKNMNCLNCLDKNNNLQMYKSDYACLYANGKWAEIVETITKSEAEKQLNKTIID